MYGLTRGTVTLIGAAVAGRAALARDADRTAARHGGYWAVYGLIAGCGPRDGALAAPRRLDEVGLAADLGRASS